MFAAVLWDLGGVVFTSPFETFARYEAANGLPDGFIRRVNAADPDNNAWARLERDEIDAAEFDDAFAEESATMGHRVAGRDVLAMLVGDIRPAMVAAIDCVKAAGLRVAALTNNIAGDPIHQPSDQDERGRDVAALLTRFDVVVESSKIGVRKPEARFYELACEQLDVEPAACVFLDDLGINLKPARAMGMTTIKVGDPAVALDELATLLGIDVTTPDSTT